MEENMEAVSTGRPHGGTLSRVLRGLRPAAPAAVGAALLGFAAALLMPMAWLSAICWNLYLDTLHPIFVEPLGGAARVWVGLGLGVITMLLATAVALALETPTGQQWRARLRRPVADDFSEFASADTPSPGFARRRSADVHPDAPPVAPINALRDLPAAGLGLVPLEQPANDLAVVEADALAAEEPLELADYAVESDAGAEPGLLDLADASLGAMVARLEAGLERQRSRADDSGAAMLPTVDLALEAALSTLARMNKAAVG